jgi:hypothetical protein
MRACGSFSPFSVNVDAREWRQLNWDGILREIEQVSLCEGMDLRCTHNGHGTQAPNAPMKKRARFTVEEGSYFLFLVKQTAS